MLLAHLTIIHFRTICESDIFEVTNKGSSRVVSSWDFIDLKADASAVFPSFYFSTPTISKIMQKKQLPLELSYLYPVSVERVWKIFSSINRTNRVTITLSHILWLNVYNLEFRIITDILMLYHDGNMQRWWTIAGQNNKISIRNSCLICLSSHEIITKILGLLLSMHFHYVQILIKS